MGLSGGALVHWLTGPYYDVAVWLFTEVANKSSFHCHHIAPSTNPHKHSSSLLRHPMSWTLQKSFLQVVRRLFEDGPQPMHALGLAQG